MVSINATLVNLFHVCQRECWLHSNGVTMEHTSATVADGKLLHETSYPQRSNRHSEIELKANYGNFLLSGKIDFYDAIEKVIHETKRSNKVEIAHEWQVKYYIWLLELNGIQGVSAILEYPTQRHKFAIVLNDADRVQLINIIKDIAKLKDSDYCPAKINSKICNSCSYYELCYVDELV